MSQDNYAFIDGQNLHSGVSAQRWKLDHKKFREYLREELEVSKAYIFLGFMEEHQDLYNALQEAGFILFFKPLIRFDDSTVKGNVDADMVLKVMIDIDDYDNAVIVSGDGDFAGLIRHLNTVKKLKKVIIPNKDTYSSLFKRMEEFDRGAFEFIGDIRSKVQYKPGGNRNQSKSDDAPRRSAAAPKPSADNKDKPARPPRAPRPPRTPRPKPQEPRDSKPVSSDTRPPRRKQFTRRKRPEDSLLEAIEQQDD